MTPRALVRTFAELTRGRLSLLCAFVVARYSLHAPKNPDGDRERFGSAGKITNRAVFAHES